MNIRHITPEETFDVRHPVLRAGKPRESCTMHGDHEDTTIHLGAWSDGTLVGVLSIFEKRHPLFDDARQFQLRGMAVLDQFRRRGFGKALIREAELHCGNAGASRIWFNARAGAVRFYLAEGYSREGNAFDIDGIGPHYIMSKRL